MKKTITSVALLSLVGLVPALHAETAYTDPVGGISKTMSNATDTRLSVPLTKAPVLAAAVSSVSSGTVTTSATVGDYTTNPHYILLTSGTLEGRWFTITAASGNNITVSENLQSLGVSANDTFKVIPFTTAQDIYPSGAGFPSSSDVFNPAATLMLFNANGTGLNQTPSSSYLYHDGSQGPAGWYDVNNLGGGVVSQIPLSPEVYYMVRNQSGSSSSVVITGNVPTTKVGTTVVTSTSAQDNLLVNPYPQGMTLDSSNLFQSGAVAASSDVFNPIDVVMVYSETPSGLNVTPTASYLYHDGSQGPAGWYDVNNLGGGVVGTTASIPAGGAFIIRKGAGSAATVSWVPAKPY